MKNIIYNLILAVIGLVIVYIIYLNYLGPNQEEFEEESADPTYPVTPYREGFEEASDDPTVGYDPADAVTPNDAQSKLEAQGLSEGFYEKEKVEEEEEKEKYGFFSNIYNFFFKPESFMNYPGGHPGSFPPHVRKRYRKWTERRRWNSHYWRSYHAHNRRIHKWHRDMARWRRWKRGAAARARRAAWRRAYYAAVRRRQAAAARARAARARAQRQRAAQPYINRANAVRNQLATVDTYHKWHNRVDKDRAAQNRAGSDSNQAYKVSLNGRNYWRNFRHQHWVHSAKYHTNHHAYRPRPGNHSNWGHSGNFHNAIRGIEAKVHDKRRRDAEARKGGLRKANWRTLNEKAKKKLGPFNSASRGNPTGSFQTKLMHIYGANIPIKSWSTQRINSAHKLIDDEYNRIQWARQAALRAQSDFAYKQAQEARNAANLADVASRQMAAAEKRLRASETAASAKQAAATANAVNNMTKTLTNTGNVVRNSNYVGRYANAGGSNGMNATSASVLTAGDKSKQAVNDLITVQNAKLASFKAVPMDAIKTISLKARQNYDKSQADRAKK